MVHKILKDRSTRLFIILSAIFITNALIAEVIGVKIFSLEKTFGFNQWVFNIFGEQVSPFTLTAGVLLWPVVFIMTDIINEYYGMKGVRFLSYLTAVLIIFAFLIYFIAIRLTPVDWWVNSSVANGEDNMQTAYHSILGQSNWIIIGSLVAFVIGQLVDVASFHGIKKITGERKVWLRATGSTLISQLIDSFIVIFIAFKIGQGWSFQKVLAISLSNYLYKFIVAIVLTPVIYWIHNVIEKYLGHDKAKELKEAAMAKKL
ncbi:MAG: queuosine precursor transporter [Chitinophagaceae bacterium]|nr:queuosine precursor transporter [Chitinophagaceae bacterium]